MADMTLTGAEESAPDFVLRDLKSADVWQLIRILGKIGISEFSKALDPALVKASRFKAPMMMQDGKEVPLPPNEWTEGQMRAAEKAQEANDALMWQILGFLMNHLGQCEAEVNKLLAMGIEKDVAFIADMNADVYMELIVQYISREGFSDFFTQAWRLLEKIGSSNGSSSIVRTLTS